MRTRQHDGSRFHSPLRLGPVLVLAGLCACGGGNPTGPANSAVASVHLAPDSLLIPVGGAGGLTADVRDSKNAVLPGATVTWTSLDPAIAVVDNQGNVGGVAVGMTKVFAAVGGKADTVPVVVVDGDCDGIAGVLEWHVNLYFLYGDNITTSSGAKIDALYSAAVAATLTPATPISGRLEWTGELVVGTNQLGQVKSRSTTITEDFEDLVSDPTEVIGVSTSSPGLPVATPGIDGFRFEVDPASCTFRFVAAPSAHTQMKQTEHAVNVLPGPNEGTHTTTGDIPLGLIQKGDTPLGDWRTLGLGVFVNPISIDAYSVVSPPAPNIDAFTPSGVFAQLAFFDPLNPVARVNKADIYYRITATAP